MHIFCVLESEARCPFFMHNFELVINSRIRLIIANEMFRLTKVYTRVKWMPWGHIAGAGVTQGVARDDLLGTRFEYATPKPGERVVLNPHLILCKIDVWGFGGCTSGVGFVLIMCRFFLGTMWCYLCSISV